MDKKLKIAVYSGEIPSTTFIERLIIGLANEGHHVHLFGYIKKKTIYNASVSIFAYKNTKLQKLYCFIKYSFLLQFFKSKKKKTLDKFIKEHSKNILLSKVKYYPVLWHHPDVFHLQWAKGLSDWMWVQEFGIKLVLSLRGAHINYSPIADSKLAKMYQNYFPQVDGFHAVSKAIAIEAEKYFATKEKIKVVYSGLDLSLFKEPIEKRNTIFEIVSIGRPHWIKGYTYALDACRKLKDNDFQFKYTIVGGANDLELVYQIQDLELQSEVVLLEKLPFSDVKELIQSSDVLLLPSVKEGVANVVLEAMALGTLVLTTDCGGMEEVIIDDVNGFLTPIRDSGKMANKIIEISNISENKKTSIIQAAKEIIENQHTEQQMIDGMLELYQSIY